MTRDEKRQLKEDFESMMAHLTWFFLAGGALYIGAHLVWWAIR